MKRAVFPMLLIAASAACMSVVPLPVNLYIESPTPLYSAGLSLDERIAVEDAWRYLREGRISRAEKILIDLPAKNPFRIAGFGYAAYILNDLSTAQAYFVQAIETFPDLPVAYMGLAQVYQAAGESDLAYRNYLEALKRDPDNPKARAEVDAVRAQKTQELMAEAQSATALGDVAKGKEAYLKALAFSPKLPEAHLGVARLYLKEKDFENALFHLRTASQNDPNNPAILAELADGLFQAGRLSLSLDEYTRVLELDPNNRAAQARVEAIRLKLGVLDLPSQFNAIPTLTAVTREDLAALIAVKFREPLEPSPSRTPVIVDISTSWALREIVKVASYDIMMVNSNRTFEPRRMVTRADMAETLVRLVSVLRKRGFRIVEQVPVERIRIADVPPDNFSFPAISEAIALQLLDLAPDRTFKPESPVSGSEAIGALDLIAGLIK
jgi:tetratricopeptide (TPR) repeat protein